MTKKGKLMFYIVFTCLRFSPNIPCVIGVSDIKNPLSKHPYHIGCVNMNI